MSFGQAFDAKEQVRQAVDIVDLVGSYVQLRRQGRNFVGLCPWHDDSRPSLQVNPDRQSFKCWVCDFGGDVFSFIMRAENLEFREALELLAERAGIDLRPPAPTSGEPGGSSPRPDPTSDKRTLYRVIAWAEAEFHRCLLESPEAEPARLYLAERGITPETAQQFKLGFAPNRWDWIVERACGTEWSPQLLERVGLLRRSDRNQALYSERRGSSPPSPSNFYDWFRGRVMFSIRDARSRPIAFGGRVLPQLADDRSAKYINSPETPLFSKSRELYALDVAREHFKDPGGAIVMEGYTDVLMAHQHGIRNCVAVLGTALGERHVQLLHRNSAEQITLVLDGDDAGRRRTNEILDALLALFEKKEVNLRILTLPQGIDPCDFIATHGSDPFRALIAEAVDPLEHKFRAVTNGLDTLTDTHRASQAAEVLLATLVQLRPAGGGASSATLLREEQMLSRIARRFHLPEEKLRSRLGSLRRESRARRRAPHIAVDAEQPTTTRRSQAKRSRGVGPRITRAADPGTVVHHPRGQRNRARGVDVARCKANLRRLLPFRRSRHRRPLWPTAHRVRRPGHEKPARAARRILRRPKPQPIANAGLQICSKHIVAAPTSATRRTDLAAARQSSDEAEQLLAQFCQQSKSKHLNEYERRKK